ncbi:MAG: 30S ribosomal protein S5 [Patescibacteria group bacterium]
MDEKDIQINTEEVATTEMNEVVATTSPKEHKGERFDNRRKNFKKNHRKSSGRERVKPEFDQKMISIRRVTRVVAGGRRFSFSVALVAGNKNGQVGVGLGKAGDTSLAIEKAFRDAKKNMIKVRTNKTKSIPHEISSKYASAIVKIMPAQCRGLIAGSSVRDVLELAGLSDITAKILSRSKNKLNNARAAIKALNTL